MTFAILFLFINWVLIQLNFDASVFCHPCRSYIGLVLSGSGGAARQFFDRNSGSFWENYHEEMVSLSLVTVKEQLTESEDFLASNPFV